MEKPIIATTLSGLFVKSEPWKKAHILWYEERERELKEGGKDTSAIEEWRKLLQEDPEREKREYFKFVDRVMEALYSELSDKERTIKARKTFFDSVCRYISEHQNVKNEDVTKYFISLKYKYRLALITTNKRDSIDKILSLTGLSNLFDIIEASMPDEKDDKTIVFDRFIKSYGKPLIFIGGDRKDSFDYCARYQIPHMFVNLEGGEDLEDVGVVHNLNELEKRLEKL